jgi:hypothetical protein
MLNYTTEYLTVSAADSYHSARANGGWSGTNEAKAAAIRRATDYIAGRYNARWNVAFDESDIPDEVEYAIAEAALRELMVPRSLTPDLKRGGAIKSVQAGSVAVTYMDGATNETVFTAIDNLLSSLVLGSGVVKLVRA